MYPDDFGKDPDLTVGSLGTTNTYIPASSCYHRLPCGYCMLMKSPCLQMPLPNPVTTCSQNLQATK